MYDFKLIIGISLGTWCESVFREIPQNLVGKINFGSDNDLVPSGTKSLSEQMFTQIYVDIWHH